MTRSTVVLAVGAFLACANVATTQTYVQTDLWQGETFFDNFNFFTDDDPNSGFVDYQSQAAAANLNLISTSTTSARFGVDSVNVVSETSRGRPSVRIQSIKSFTEGLFVADIAHMPGDACGIWPAFWTLGSGTWPQNGEIDIIEGVNLYTQNQYTLHTGDGTCNITPIDETGTLLSSDCTTTQNGQIVNTAGCGIRANTPNNYGDAFNSNGGGTYVMQWTDSFINIWFFPRGQEPATLSSSSPDVSKFGIPDANFAGCDIAAHFADNSIVFDTDFCGDYAANDAIYPAQCITIPNAPAWQSCVQLVANEPSAYSEGYWEVNFIKIFSEATTTSSSSSSSSSSTSSTSSSTSSPSSSQVSSTSSSSYGTSSSSVSSTSSSSLGTSSSSVSSTPSSSLGTSSSSVSSSSPASGKSSSPVVSSSRSHSSATVPTSSRNISPSEVFTTSTFYSTQYYTITACPSSVTNCPANQKTTSVITSVVPVCPTASTFATSHARASSPVSTPNPQSQYTSPGFKGYPTTPQAAGATAATVTAPYGAGNGTAKATGAGATKSSPLQVSVNGGEKRKAGFMALVGAVVFAVVVA